MGTVETASKMFGLILMQSVVAVCMLDIVYMILYNTKLKFKDMAILHQSIALSYAVSATLDSNILVYIIIYMICSKVVNLWHSIRLGR